MEKIFTQVNFEVRGDENAVDILKDFPHIKEKLKRALTLSTEMSAAAYWKLFEFDNAWRINPTGAEKNTSLTEVEVALLKYFSLEPALRDVKTRDGYLRTVDRIRSVFRQIDHGLTLGRCQIDLVLIDQKTNARVELEDRKRNERKDLTKERVARPWENKQVSPIRLNFGYTTEWDHKPWKMAIGNIELNIQYLNGAREDEIARTIVHEASHKYAQTKDILYKHQSFAKSMNSDLVDFLVDQGHQSEISVPEYQKKVRPMTGVAKGGGGAWDKAEDRTSFEKLLENADSYAWLARRLWKRKTGFKKKAA